MTTEHVLFLVNKLERFKYLQRYDFIILEKNMYPYHNMIKQRIQNGELIKFEYVEKYKQIQPALLLYFKTEPFIKPVREHRFEEYKPILEKWERNQID